MSINRYGENNPNWKGGLITISCKVCEKTRKVKRKDLKAGAKYCSRKCAQIGIGRLNSERDKLERIKKNCIICKKELFIKPSHVSYEGAYCSKKCQNQDYKTRFLGKDNPNWKDGITYDRSKYTKSLRDANPEYYRKQAREWIRAHPEVRMAGTRRYRAKKKLVSGGHFSEPEWLDLVELYGNKCLCCGRTDVELTRDHVVPLSPGLDTIDNIQPLCRSCNSRKGRRTIDYRLQYFPPQEFRDIV